MRLSCQRAHRWLLMLGPLLMTAGCNPSIYFSTGTTVGLEATPPTGETPPAITFGYKRAELALVPVVEFNPPSDGQAKLTGKSSDLGCSETKNDAKPHNQTGTADTGGSGDGKAQPRQTTKVDAFSVLAVFHLAVNWFGPAKIEQHFATGCAARNLIHGLTEEEEDKRLAEEARQNLKEAEELVKTATEGAQRLKKHAEKLENDARELKKKIEDDAGKLAGESTQKEKETREKKLRESGEKAKEWQQTAERLKSELNGINRLEEAKDKAESAQHKAEQAMNTEEVRPGAKQTKESAEKLVSNLKGSAPDVAALIKDAQDTLENVLTLLDQVKAKVPAKGTS